METTEAYTFEMLSGNSSVRDEILEIVREKYRLSIDEKDALDNSSNTELFELYSSEALTYDDIREYLYTWSCTNCNESQLSSHDSYSCEDTSGLCEYCYEHETHMCDGCDNAFISELSYNDDTDQYLCDDCYDNQIDDVLPELQKKKDTYYRESSQVSISTRNVQAENYGKIDEVGEIVKSYRGYSAEIEFYITSPLKVYKAIQETPKCFGVSRDGSLSSAESFTDTEYLGNGLEIQTGILHGIRGEQSIIDLTNNLSGGAIVDRTCGLHIHLDLSDVKYNIEVLKRIMIFHLVFENVLHSILPQERRANRYCKSLRDSYTIEEIKNVKSVSELEQIWYRETNIERIQSLKGQRYNETRYRGVNFHSLLAQGHIEIRYHSGTLNSKKILEWANLHARIIDFCAGTLDRLPTYTDPAISVEKEILRLQNMMERIRTMTGATQRDVLMYNTCEIEIEILKQQAHRIRQNAPVTTENLPSIESIEHALDGKKSLTTITEVFCKMLGISKSSKRYILKRQKKFANTTETTENDLTVSTIASKEVPMATFNPEIAPFTNINY